MSTQPTFPPPPTFASPIEFDAATKAWSFNPVWLGWFMQLVNVFKPTQGRTLGAPTSGSAGTSPYAYQNTANFEIDVTVQGTGTSKIEFSRDGSTYYDTGATNGMFRLSPLDYLRVTWATSAPTMTAIPR